ncbi:hypothetical protein ACR9PO_003203, partial [Cronobacter sakazakii]
TPIKKRARRRVKGKGDQENHSAIPSERSERVFKFTYLSRGLSVLRLTARRSGRRTMREHLRY